MLWFPDTRPQFRVLIKRGEFIDSARGNRDVPYKIYYPADHTLDRIPVIIWSHGYGGSRDGAAFISRYVASFGYAIIHLSHRGSDSALWEGKDGHPWDILRAHKVPRSDTLDRFYDVPFALDALQKWITENNDITTAWDMSALGMSGHSFGAMTTQVMAGQRVPDETGTLMSLKDNRFTCGIAYSPVPISHLSDAPDTKLYGGIDIPLLHMTGTNDTSPLENFEYDHRLLVYKHTDKADKYLLIKDGGDHMIYNGTRGKLKENPMRQRHEKIIQDVSLAFWDAHLNDSAHAQNWLDTHAAAAYLQDAATLQKG